ncbi:hypothetical protein FGD67_21550 [Colwellia sp. M166]|uniref:hypothetical protein n=1 Tax=Colwellia sp. M166 TaxID=2583805 RepID=UPI00211E8DC0|nr:hypothetical protein [Colwellia sp. M166]UUO25511.1 hypothetical protein FGD67_21550 [Colwellia sp. M166]
MAFLSDGESFINNSSLTSYQLLIDWSETAAIIVATSILYSFILLTANYRLSRHYSMYIQDEKTHHQ